eukprot:TRINITY_DN2651_c0_g1_i1.p1 TRINITY_DN2651_c0_g1~~TRINITY_DN2651_c0_g1_i1.p1  ORF type:complete len:290 (+),score=13.04 TRINITY_DN2651_c0_g1_i1:112-981(+)
MEIESQPISKLSLALRCAAAGGVAGTLTEGIFYPLETLKTYLQESQSRVRISERIKKGRLYSGFSCVLGASLPCNALFFFVYEYASAIILSKYKDQFKERKELVFFTCATLAELVGSTLNNPIEVVRQNMQLLSYERPRDAIKDIWVKTGIRGFFSGYLPALCRTVPFSILQLPLYEHFQRVFSRKGGRWDHSKALLSGGLSCLIAAIVTNPFDVIKTRMMANAANKQELSAIDWLKKTVRQEGLRGLLKGCHYRAVGMGVGGMFYYWCYAAAFKLFGASESYNKIRQQ